MPPTRSALLLAVAGVLLAAAGTAVPAGTAQQTTYVYEPTQPISLDGDYQVSVHGCGYPEYQSQRCVVASALADGATVSVNESAVERPFFPATDYVELREQYYEPVLRDTADGPVVALDRVPVADVRAAAARNVTDDDSLAARAVTEGVARTDERLPAHQTYVRYGGDYHLLRVADVERDSAGWLTGALPDVALEAARFACFLAGFGLVWLSGRRYQQAA